MKYLILIILILLVACSPTIPFAAQGTPTAIPVSPVSLQTLIDNTPPGGTLVVPIGSYLGYNVIQKPMTISCVVPLNCLTKGFRIFTNGVSISGFNVMNENEATNGIGIYIQGNNNIVKNNYIHDAWWGGIMVWNGSLNVNVSNNILYHNGQVGIDFRGNGGTIQDNEISYTEQYPVGRKYNPSYADADGVRFNGSNNLFDNNYIHDINYGDPTNPSPHIDCFQTFADANHPQAVYDVFLNNRCINPWNAATTGAGTSGWTMQDASNIVIENNIVTTTMGFFIGGLVSGVKRSTNNVTITGNAFAPSSGSYAGIGYINYDDSVSFAGNTIYGATVDKLYTTSSTNLVLAPNTYLPLGVTAPPPTATYTPKPSSTPFPTKTTTSTPISPTVTLSYCQSVATQAAQCNLPTQSPITTPSPTPPVQFDPFDGSIDPVVPAVYEVAPMSNDTWSTCKLATYTVSGLPNNYFPATCWAQYWSGGSTLNFTYCPASVMNIGLTKINSTWAFNYLNKTFDGEKFSAGFREGIIYPSTEVKNTVHILSAKFLKLSGLPAQWYGIVDTLPCTATMMNNINMANMPSYYFQHQSNMTYNGEKMSGLQLMGQDAIMILTHSKSSEMLIPMAQLLGVK